jgi:hypothetical protein
VSVYILLSRDSNNRSFFQLHLVAELSWTVAVVYMFDIIYVEFSLYVIIYVCIYAYFSLLSDTSKYSNFRLFAICQSSFNCTCSKKRSTRSRFYSMHIIHHKVDIGYFLLQILVFVQASKNSGKINTR